MIVRMGEWQTEGEEASCTGIVEGTDYKVTYIEDYDGYTWVTNCILILKEKEDIVAKHNCKSIRECINKFYEMNEQKDIDNAIIKVVEVATGEKCELVYNEPIPTVDFAWEKDRTIGKVVDSDLVLIWVTEDDESYGELKVMNSKGIIETIDMDTLERYYGRRVQESVIDEDSRYMLEYLRDTTGKLHWVCNVVRSV